MSDVSIIHQIAARAVDLYLRLDLIEERDSRFTQTAIAAEITFVHTEVVKLRLQDLLDAEDLDFAHDVGGIHKHLDIRGKTAELTKCFMPRFADIRSLGHA